jgi:hypothetical protein
MDRIQQTKQQKKKKIVVVVSGSGTEKRKAKEAQFFGSHFPTWALAALHPVSPRFPFLFTFLPVITSSSLGLQWFVLLLDRH